MPKRKRNRVRPGTLRKRRRLAIGLVGVFGLLSAFVAVNTLRPLTSKALAQQHGHSSHASGQTFEPLLDGSEQPGLIPDAVAIRALMQTLRVPPNPDAIALKRLHARVDRVNFGAADMDILVRELGSLDTRANDQQARIEAVRPSSAEANGAAIARYVEERKRLESLVVDHYQQLLASLSPEGVAKLQEHLLHVKSRIRIYPTPDMSARIN